MSQALKVLPTCSAILAAGASCLFTEKGLEEPHLDLLLEANGTGTPASSTDGTP